MKERGSVIILFSVTLFVLVVFAALAVDVGLGITHKRSMQGAADAASLAGAYKLSDAAFTVNDVKQTIKSVAQLNLISPGELSDPVIGNWNFATKVFLPNAAPYNAAKAQAVRTLPIYFSRVINVPAFNLNVQSVSVVDSASSATCLIPFGITNVLLGHLNLGDHVIVGNNGSGNWGKVQIGDSKINSKPDFEDALLAGVCAPMVHVGDSLPSNTGFAGIDEGFPLRIAQNPTVLMPVVSDFGDGTKPVTVMGFVSAMLEASQGEGNGWTLQFRIIPSLINGLPGGPSGPLFAKARVLVQ